MDKDKARRRIEQAADEIGFVPLIEWDDDGYVRFSEDNKDFKLRIPEGEVTEADFETFKSNLAFFYNEVNQE